MDAATLSTAMGGMLSMSAYQAYVGPMNNAMIAANINNVNRAAMWCAQLGHESLGLFYMQEVASGANYNPPSSIAKSLGNTQPGDGPRFKGRGPIQLTGRSNYGKFGMWCLSKGFVTDGYHFVTNPTLVATPQWGFLAASWYWTVARADLNALSDAGNVSAATQRINGGQNGEADRVQRWNRARPLGVRLLPTSTEVPDLDANQAKQLAAISDRIGKYDALDRDLRWSSGVERAALDSLVEGQKLTNQLLQQLLAKP